jgi:hypothetical protein
MPVGWFDSRDVFGAEHIASHRLDYGHNSMWPIETLSAREKMRDRIVVRLAVRHAAEQQRRTDGLAYRGAA